jgi:uncharacterized membrane protein
MSTLQTTSSTAKTHSNPDTATRRTLKRIGYAITWGLAFVGVFTALIRYLLPHEAHLAVAQVLYGPYAPEQLPVLAREPATELSHRLGGFVYMLFGLVQFQPGIRARHPHFHRWTGRAFVVLGIAEGISGLVMATFYPYAGIRESIPAYLFGSIFLYSHVLGFLHARRGDISRHREWMIRGFALGLGVPVIRVVYLVCLYATDWPAKECLITAFWLGWSVSLLAGEWWIGYTRLERTKAASPRRIR